MPRRSIPSNHPVADVRRYLNLDQQQVADYLGVSVGLIKHIEAGRWEITSAMYLRLMPLLLLVPQQAVPDADDFDDAPLAAPLPQELEYRRRECLHKAGQLRRKMRPLARRTRFAKRWQQVLPGLLAASPTENSAAPDPHAARVRRWLLARQADAAADLDEFWAAEWHLLRVRAEALEAEAAALAALLAPAAPAASAAAPPEPPKAVS